MNQRERVEKALGHILPASLGATVQDSWHVDPDIIVRVGGQGLHMGESSTVARMSDAELRDSLTAACERAGLIAQNEKNPATG